MPVLRQRKPRRYAARDTHGAPRPLVLPPPATERERPRAIVLALTLTGLFHFLLWQTVPEHFGSGLLIPVTPVDISKVTIQEPGKAKPDEIAEELLPPELREKKPEPPPKPKPRFVEVNPEAPTNEPNPTINEGAATQRAAQPEPDKNPNDLPANTGEEPDSTRIANNIPRDLLPKNLQPEAYRPLGQPEAPKPAPATPKPTADPWSKPLAEQTSPNRPKTQSSQKTPAAPETSPASVAESPKALEGPAPAQDRPKLSPNNAAGIAVSPAPGKAPPAPEIAENTGAESVQTPSEKKQTGEKNGKDSEKKNPPATEVAKPAKPVPAAPAPASGKVEIVAGNETPAPAAAEPVPQGDRDGTPVPRPRPKAARVGTTGITMKKSVGTNEAGMLALNARYSEFGDYTQRMIETIQAQWWLTVDRSRIRESFDSKVIVGFTLRRDGTVHDVAIIFTSASVAGTYACQDAIESRAPFDPWREDMVAALGDEERGTFTFYYR